MKQSRYYCTFCLLCLLVTGVVAQSRKVNGRVIDATGSGLPGATVIIKNTTTGTATDGEGRFSLDIPDANATLTVSSIGFIPEDVAVGGQTTLTISLVADIKSLNEVVVVGYGTQQRRDLTGSVASVSEREIKAVPVVSLDQALQGRAAGVQITQNSAAPGGAVSVRVRGTSSFGSNEPLYVIDGVPIYSDNGVISQTNPAGGGQRPNPLASLNPNDIESIDILKDASATAIYGTRGANGVVIVTTKRGKSGAPRLTFDAYYGLQSVWKQLDVLNARQFAELNTEARRNDLIAAYRGGDPLYGDIGFANLDSVQLVYGEGTDWQREVLRDNAPVQNYQVGLSGGAEKIRYAFMGGYYGQDGVVRGSSFRRYSLRVNLDADVSKHLRTGMSLALTRSENNLVVTDGNLATGAVIQPTLTFLPTIAVRDADGKFNVKPPAAFANLTNPSILATQNRNVLRGIRALGNVYGEADLIQDMKLRSSFGFDLYVDAGNTYTPSFQQGLGSVPAAAAATSATGMETMWINENTLAYQRRLGHHHQLNALAGISLQSFRRDFTYGKRIGFSSDDLTTLDNGKAIAELVGSYGEYALLSFIGRVNYTFRDRYLLTATVRRDGSSRFGVNNRFGTFPSASVGWRLSEEPFMKTLSFLSEAKLRASYGLAGYQEIGNYSFASLMALPTPGYVLGDAQVQSSYPLTLSNDNLSWESTAQLDLGLDLGLFNDRVTLTADYYVKNTDKLLINRRLPAVSGFVNPYLENLGATRNTGVELAVSSRNLTGALEWTTDLNLSHNRSILVSYPGAPASGLILAAGGAGLTILREGEPLGAFYGLQVDGVFANQAAVDAYTQDGNLVQPLAKPGDVRFRDANGDGKIDPNDRVVIGNAQPKLTYGFTNRLACKGFELSVFLQGVYGNDVYNATRNQTENLLGNQNQLATVKDRWRSESQPGNGTMPRSTFSDANQNAQPYTSRWIEDGSFLRVRNLTLAYQVPSALSRKGLMQSLRVYISAQNLYTFTQYRGFDPEFSSNGQSALFPGYDLGAFPQSRTFLVGLNAAF